MSVACESFGLNDSKSLNANCHLVDSKPCNSHLLTLTRTMQINVAPRFNHFKS